jgi:hypothetical protein
MKDKFIMIKVDEEQKESYKKEAKKEGRSLSNWILWACNQLIKGE